VTIQRPRIVIVRDPCVPFPSLSEKLAVYFPPFATVKASRAGSVQSARSGIVCVPLARTDAPPCTRHVTSMGVPAGFVTQNFRAATATSGDAVRAGNE
jgi:hypothetical protein